MVIALFEKLDEVGVVRSLNDTSEMHSVVTLIFLLEHQLEVEVIMAFLKGIKRNVLVVLNELLVIWVLSCTRSCRVIR